MQESKWLLHLAVLGSLPRPESGYWEEGWLEAFIAWSATGASWGAPEIPWGSHGRLLLLEKQEQSWGFGVGLVKLRLWESLRPQRPTSSGAGF